MLPFIVLTYGFLMSFVIASAMRNRREGRRNPLIVMAVGYVLCGMSAAAAMGLPLWASQNPAAAAQIVQLP